MTRAAFARLHQSDRGPETSSGDLIEPTAAAALNTHAIVASLLEPVGEGAILDIGAGKGNFTNHLRDHQSNIVALDIDAVDYRYSDAPFICANLDDGIPIRTGSVCGVVAIEILEHLENPLLIIREATRCLRVGGWLIITTPNVLSLASRLELLLRKDHEDFDTGAYTANGHISPLSLRQILRIADRCGLTVVAETYNVGKLPIPYVRHRWPLRGTRFRTSALGESLILKLRKTARVQREIERG